MPEYLSPGVYVEEYESGAVPMEGVGTSTAGFVGLAEKGAVIGKPELVTSFSDYVRIFGGYLSERQTKLINVKCKVIDQAYTIGKSLKTDKSNLLSIEDKVGVFLKILAQHYDVVFALLGDKT